MPKPKPSFVRVLNLAPVPLKLVDGNRSITQPASTNLATNFVPFGTGNRKLTIVGTGVSIPYQTSFAPEQVSTLVVGPDEKTIGLIDTELRKPTGDRNVTLVFVDSTGTILKNGPSLNLSNGTVKVAVDPTKPVPHLIEGDWHLTINGKPWKSPLTVEGKNAYTLAIICKPGGAADAVFLNDTPALKPVSAGAASS